MGEIVTITGVVQPGYRVASGLATDSPYPAGTIALQTPHFLAHGLDLRPYYAGTLNISIAPHQFQLLQADHTFSNLQWIEGCEPESFSFVAGQILWQSHIYDCLLYYPHPETKINHFQDPRTMEILAPKIVGIAYGDDVTLHFSTDAVALLLV